VFADELLAAATAGRPLTRDMAGRAIVYLQARTHYGILDPTVLDGLRSVWRQVLGERDLAALDDLFARVIWIPDGELEALDRASREYHAIIGPPDPPPSEDRDTASTDDPASGGSGDQPAAGSLGEALEQALEQSRGAQLAQLDADIDLEQVLADAAARREESPATRSGPGTGMPTGRMPHRRVDRPPAPDEVQHARRYATRLRQAMTQGTKRIDKRTPGGRFDGRAYARGNAQRQTGRPVSTHPWRITRRPARTTPEDPIAPAVERRLTTGASRAFGRKPRPPRWPTTRSAWPRGGQLSATLAILAILTRSFSQTARRLSIYPARCPHGVHLRSTLSIFTRPLQTGGLDTRPLLFCAQCDCPARPVATPR
jgi:hypothetical protein